ncbi:MAG: hypothetical protein HY426_03650 [Candidatus Levybacteria bacterium]|nr:hypothetical protein [Candidatus Levybacteria bacterium]
MNYITTNIRISEEDYLKLKAEAAKNRKSLSAIIREKIGNAEKINSEAEAKSLLEELDEVAKENAKYTKSFDSVKALREIRYQKNDNY